MVQADRIKTVAIVGCTAVGKSNTALKLAKRFNGVLIGADSMQIYRGFDIGTGKLTKSECGDIEHLLIDVVDGDAEFSVGEYVKLADAAVSSAVANGKTPIIVGGTGLYVNALLSGSDFGGTAKDADLRNKLKFLAHIFGSRTLHGLLNNVDKEAAAGISANDVKRIVRALEIFALTGVSKTNAVGGQKRYDYLLIVLTLPRDILYERINKRVAQMFDDGLIDEARSLERYSGCQAMQALGYKQIAEFSDMPVAELKELTARKTRNYAKRQITYFKNMKLHKVFIDARDYDSVEKCVAEFLEK